MISAFISDTNAVEGTDYTGQSRRDRREKGKLVEHSFIHLLLHSFIQQILMENF